MPRDFDWMVLINKRAALKEQFPSLRKVMNERPGCAVDIERQRMNRAATELQKEIEHRARWARSVQENARRLERENSQRRIAGYKAHQKARDERKAS